MSNVVYALAVSGTDLYAGAGNFSYIGGATNFIARWNGNSWTTLGSGVNGDVLALAAVGNDVYAGGGFTIAGGSPANRVAKWDGSSWTALGSGMGNTVSALAVSGSDLYAGGDFTTAGGNTAPRIAKWDGSAWISLGSGMNNSVNALAISGTNLYVGGQFTIAGNKVSAYAAKANISTARGRFTNSVYSPATGFSCTFLDASVGQPYRIQTSPTLTAGPWTDFTNFTYTGPIVITDASALSGTNKFFRAITP